MRRLASAFGIVAACLVFVAPGARADTTEIDSGAYAGTRLLQPGDRVDSSTVPIEAEIQVSGGSSLEVRIQFTAINPLPEGCPAPSAPGRADTTSLGGGRYRISVTGTAECNGSYRVIVKPQRCQPILGCDPGVVLEKTVQVSEPPANVAGVTGAQGEDGKVTIKWTPNANPGPDFSGYTVERRDGSSWVQIGRVDRSKSSFTEPEIPPGDSATYRVLARRSTGQGEIGSPKPTTVDVPLRGDGTTTTVPPDGSTTTVPGDGGPSTTGGGTPTTGGSGGGSKGGSSGGNRGQTGVGTKAPRLGSPSNANFPPLLAEGDEEDGGFSEELPFDQGLPGQEDDDFASLVYEDESGRGMAVPVGIGFVMAAWAFHLRFLARASRG